MIAQAIYVKGELCMNDTIASWLAIGVEVLITSVLIMALVAVMMASQTVTAAVLEQDAMAAEMQEYREYNQFDNRHVHMQDIVAVVLKWKGIPYTSVTGLGGGTRKWSPGSSDDVAGYSTVRVSGRLDPTKRYHSVLKKSPNGEVLGFEFAVCNGGASCAWSG
jgi:DMSO/TMAO reductase YedYZ molybdopterin-dependent catalytic subunit